MFDFCFSSRTACFYYPELDAHPLPSAEPLLCCTLSSVAANWEPVARIGDCVYSQATGSLGATVHVDARMVCPCPPALAGADAAAVPTVFLTALACLQLAAHVQPGTRVLVHAATGTAVVSLLVGCALSWALADDKHAFRFRIATAFVCCR